MRTGDEKAFAVLGRRYRAAMTRYARKLLRGTGVDAKPAVAKALDQARGGLKPRGRRSLAVGTWLFSLARDAAIDELRIAKEEPQPQPIAAEPRPSPSQRLSPNPRPSRASPSPNPRPSPSLSPSPNPRPSPRLEPEPEPEPTPEPAPTPPTAEAAPTRRRRWGRRVKSTEDAAESEDKNATARG